MGHIYSKDFLDHLENTQNVGEIPNPDGVGKAHSETCGDFLRIMITVDDGVIKDIKFKVYGCATAIAGGSVATEIAKGMKLDDVLKLDEHSLLEKLGDIPDKKIDCLKIVIKALHEAIQNYLI